MNKTTLCVAVFVALIGCGVTLGQIQAPINLSSCIEANFAVAEEILRQGGAETLRKALESYDKALNCDALSLSDTRKAEILLNIGRVHLLLEQNQEALTALSAALELFHRVENPSSNVAKEEISAVLNKALALRGLQRIDEALAAYGEAHKRAHKLGDTSKESRALEDICHMKLLMGENRVALQDCQEALRLLNKTHRLTKDNQRHRAVLFDFLGRTYARMNDSNEATHYFRGALALARKIHYQRLIAYTLNDLGALLLRQEQSAIAERQHEEALELLKKYELNNTDGIAETLAYLADAQSADGKNELAIQNYQHALLLQQRSGDAIGEAETRVSLGILQLASREPEAALESLQRAADLFHRVHERIGESTARFQIAKIHVQRGDNAREREQANEAIRLAEEVRGFTPGFRLRTTYFASLEEMYRFQIDVLLRKEQVPQSDQLVAFDLLQRARSRALLDVLESRLSDKDSACGDELLAQRNKVLNELSAENRKLGWLLAERAKRSPEETPLAIKRLEAELDEIEAQCELERPRLALFSGGSISVSDIQGKLLDADSVLLQFYLSRPFSYAWIITKSAVRLIRLPARENFEQQVRKAVKYGDAGDWTASQQNAVDALYKGLVPAFQVAGSKRWIIVPDGALYYLPFAFFATKGIAPSEIIKIPSPAAIQVVRNTQIVKNARVELALFADPVFDAQDSRVRSFKSQVPGAISDYPASRREHYANRGSYARLVYSRREAQLISRLLPPFQRKVFLDFNARLEAATGNALDNFRIIHFATHSLIGNRHPDSSRIVLSLVEKNGHARPGYLKQEDIYRMRLHSDLVVLSSCRSAIGSEDAGEGLMSLSRAFFFAGSKSVLASLWKVDDEVTAEFMGRFYRHILKETLAPSKALAKTQAEFRHHPITRLRNPYYWAGFELYGDWLLK